MAQIIVHPKKALADEPLHIRVTGLLPSQIILLQASLTDDKGRLFHSHAFYKANENGEVDVDHMASIGGDYVGIHPMGLFWSMKPEKILTRLMKQDVINRPFLVQLKVCDGGESFFNFPSTIKAMEIVERWYSVPGVQRIQIREGQVRGALFLPPGEGPFPGVIDLFGRTGGLIEFRASLLASRGFATLALAYVSYEDLPKNLDIIDIEYFEEAANLLLRHPKVLGPRIGVVSVSLGACIGMAMAIYLKQVAATVCINGFYISAQERIKYRNEQLYPSKLNLEMIEIDDLGLLKIKNSFGNLEIEENKQSLLPVERAHGNILFIVGENDCNVNSKFFAEKAIEQMRRNGKSNGMLLSYPGAGHLIEPPYSPACLASQMSFIKMPVLWGGKTALHAKAQEHSWKEILKFLKYHLTPASSSKL